MPQNMIDRAYSTTPTATTIASWDASANLSAHAFMAGSLTGPVAATIATIQTVGVNAAANNYIASYINTSGSSPTEWFYKSRSTIVGSFTTVQTNDVLGRLEFYGDDGTQFTNAAAITIQAAGTISNGVVPGNITISTANASGVLTTAAIINQAQQLSLTVPLQNVSGGTGVTSVTTVPAASNFAGWDVNKNLSANSIIEGYATTATAAATTTLTVASAQQQYFTGTTTQTVLLPVTSTLALGQSFYIVNNSTGVVTVESSNGSTIVAMAASTTLLVTCILTSGITPASWNFEYLGAVSGGTVNPGTINQLTWYAASGSTVSGLATANNGLLVTSSGGIPSIGNSIGADITVHGITVGQGAFVSATNTALGAAVASSNVSAAAFTGVGAQAFSALVSGNNNTGIGYSVGTTAGFAANLTTGSANTFLGSQSGSNDSAAVGTLAIGAFAVADKATGATSSDNGPGIAIGSSTDPVGFRGDATIYPGFMGAGNWRAKINDTYYKIPLLADGATTVGAVTAASVTFSPTTGGIVGTITNDNAAAGKVGEYVESVIAQASAVTFTLNTSRDLTSISLTAGDWDVWGNITYTAIGTVPRAFFAWLSASSNTFPDDSLINAITLVVSASGTTLGINTGVNAPMQRFSLSGTSNIYISGQANATSGNASGCGRICARRVR